MNEEILGRLDSLERRLSRIENIMGGGRPKEPARPVTPPPPNPSSTVDSSKKDSIDSMIETYVPNASTPPSDSSQASRVLGFVGALCFIGAAIFLIQLAISVGWLTPTRQVGLAGLFGIFLVFMGIHFRNRDAHYLSLLSGAGVIILDLAALGGYALYDIYPAQVAVMAVAVVSVISVYLYSVFRSEWYAVLAVLGAYIGLFCLRSSLPLAGLTTYYIVWDTAFALMALGLRSRLMILLAAYLALGGYHLQAVGFAFSNDAWLMLVGVQAFQFSVFALASVLFSVRHQRPFTSGEAWAFFPLIVFFYGIEYWMLHKWDPTLTPWIAVAFAGFLHVLYFMAKQRLSEQLHSGSLVSALGSLVLLHAVYWNILSDRMQAWAGPAILVVAALLGWRAKVSKEYSPYFAVLLMIVLLSLYQLFFASYPYNYELVGMSAVYFIAFAAMYAWLRASNPKQLDKSSLGFVILALGISQFMLGSYRFIIQLGQSSQVIAGYAPFWISSTWGVFGLLGLAGARVKRDPVWAKASLLLVSCTTLKVLLFDAASSSAAIRISCLLVTGVVLYLGGYMLRSIKSWQ